MARALIRDASGSPGETPFFLDASCPTGRRPASLDRALVAGILVLLTCASHATLSAADTTRVVAVAAPARSLVFAPDGSRHGLVVSPTGLGLTSDGGKTWNVEEPPAASFLMDADFAGSDGTVYLATGFGPTDFGLYRSMDYGVTWSRLPSPPE